MTPNYTSTPNYGAELAPIVPGEQVPEYRLVDAAHAQTIVSVYMESAKARNAMNASYQGQIDGNPPYRPSVLKNEGRTGDPNVNMLGAAGMINTGLVPYYDIFTGSKQRVVIKTDHGKGREKVQWSRTISQEFTRMLDRWQNFNLVMLQMLTDFLPFGKGFLMWEPNGSWHCTPISYHQVLVADGAKIDLDKLELVIVLQDWPMHELYGKIRNKTAAKAVGWNVEETMRALSYAVPKSVFGEDYGNPIRVQQAIHDNDLYVSQVSSSVPTATLFVREFDCKWSECMVRRYDTQGNDVPVPGGKATKKLQYMFESRKKKDSILESLVPFFFNMSNRTWNGATGLARDIYGPMQVKDRLACTQIGAAFLRNSLVLQPRQALDRSKLNLLQIGPVTWLPPNCEVHQGQILGDIAATIEVSREMDTVLQRNTGIYMPTLEKGPGNPKTLGQFNKEFAQATVLSNAAVDFCFLQLDRFYQAMWLKVIHPASGSDEAAREARLFKQRCIDAGVPEEAFKKVEPENIRAWRPIGNGSIAKRQESLAGFMGMYPLFHTNGQRALLEDIVEASGSEDAVDRYMPEDDWNGVPNDDQWAANMENAVLKIGGKADWTPSQDNVIHANTHMEAAGEAAASLPQGGDPLQVLQFMDAVAPHTLIHIQHAKSDPTKKSEVKMLEKQWGMLAQTADQLRAKVQQDMQAQQQQMEKTQEVMTDAQIKQFETQEKLKLSGQKALGTLQLKGARQQADLGMKQTDLQAKLSREDAQAAAEIKRKNALSIAKAIAEANRNSQSQSE